MIFLDFPGDAPQVQAWFSHSFSQILKVNHCLYFVLMTSWYSHYKSVRYFINSWKFHGNVFLPVKEGNSVWRALTIKIPFNDNFYCLKQYCLKIEWLTRADSHQCRWKVSKISGGGRTIKHQNFGIFWEKFGRFGTKIASNWKVLEGFSPQRPGSDGPVHLISKLSPLVLNGV